LKTLIKNLRRQNADRRYYVPLSAFYHTITYQHVRKVLVSAGIEKYHLDETAKRILADGRKIFAILLLIDQPALVANFIDEDQLQDHLLPFDEKVLGEISSNLEIKEFMEKQGEFLTPTFTIGTFTRFTNDTAALPFTKDSEIGRGHHSNVFEIAIDPEHQVLENPFRQRVSLVVHFS
jgi:hypothetical protein